VWLIDAVRGPSCELTPQACIAKGIERRSRQGSNRPFAALPDQSNYGKSPPKAGPRTADGMHHETAASIACRYEGRLEDRRSVRRLIGN
jgi:hypothetical protein